jgi:hypothetical protein
MSASNGRNGSPAHGGTPRKNGHGSPYRLDLLPVVPAYCRRALRERRLEEGHLVYYGPSPAYYGIGEVTRVADGRIAVDFRGTGTFRVHEEIFEQRYLIRIPPEKLGQL